MEKGRKRRRFTAEFNAEAVKRLDKSGRVLHQVADELGLHANQLRTRRDELRADGARIGRKRVAQLMREAVLVAVIRHRLPRATGSRRDQPAAPDLLGRNFFAAVHPDAVRLADIGSIPTDEGSPYPAAVKDTASREVVSWSTAEHPRAELACNALRMAIHRRQVLFQ